MFVSLSRLKSLAGKILSFPKILTGRIFFVAAALTNKIADREIFIKGIDASYFYENYFAYRAQELL